MKKEVLYIIVENRATSTSMLQETLFDSGFTWGGSDRYNRVFGDDDGSIRIRLNLNTQSMSYYTLQISNVPDSVWIRYSNAMYGDTAINTEIIRYSAATMRKINNFLKNKTIVNYSPRTIIKNN